MILPSSSVFFFFFFNDTATTEIYTLSLHDALPISPVWCAKWRRAPSNGWRRGATSGRRARPTKSPSSRSEEHTSELQSRLHLVCRLLLEKKKNKDTTTQINRPHDRESTESPHSHTR